MSLQFIDGFDHYTEILDKWDSNNFTGGTGTFTTQNRGRFTPGALQITGFEDVSGRNAGNADITKIFKTPGAEFIMGFAIFFDETNAGTIIRFEDSVGANVGGITFAGTDITMQAGGSTVKTISSTVTSLAWTYYELRVKSHATLGEIELHKAGVLLDSVTGVNTTGNDIAQMTLFHIAETDNSYLDDLYVLDTKGVAPQNTFLGDVRVTALRPKANGNFNNFTPTGAATNWEATDETLHDGDTTFVEAGQLAAQEDYDNKDFVDIGVTPATIFGVQTVNAAKKTDAGQLKYKDEMVIAGVRFDDGTEVTATSGTYKMTTFIRDTDPSDSATWTEAKVAAVGSGFTITFREV